MSTPNVMRDAELERTASNNSKSRDAIEKARQAELATALHGLQHAPVSMPIVAGADLFERVFPPRQEIVAGLISRGNLVLLAGRPKSGKSWLLLQLAEAIDTGRAFLNRTTTPASVLYLALEDGERRIHERIRIRKWKPKNVSFAFGLVPLSDEGMNQLANAAAPYDVVFIDTLRAACGAGVDENDNAEMGAIVQALANYAHTEDKTVLITHHTRKGDADDAFDLIRGAGAIRGAYDVGIVIQRKPKEAEATLQVESRDIEADDMTIKFDGATGWSYEGNAAKLNDIRAGRYAVKALQELGDDEQTTDAVAEHLGVSRQAAGQQLRGAEREKVVTRRREAGGKGKKARDLWSLVP